VERLAELRGEATHREVAAGELRRPEF